MVLRTFLRMFFFAQKDIFEKTILKYVIPFSNMSYSRREPLRDGVHDRAEAPAAALRDFSGTLLRIFRISVLRGYGY